MSFILAIREDSNFLDAFLIWDLHKESAVEEASSKTKGTISSYTFSISFLTSDLVQKLSI